MWTTVCFCLRFASILFAWLGEMRFMEISIVRWLLLNVRQKRYSQSQCDCWALGMHGTARGALRSHQYMCCRCTIVFFSLLLKRWRFSPWLVPSHNVIIVGIGRHCRCGKYAVTKWYTEYTHTLCDKYIDYTQATKYTWISTAWIYLLCLPRCSSERKRDLSLSHSLSLSFCTSCLLACCALLPLFCSLSAS